MPFPCLQTYLSQMQISLQPRDLGHLRIVIRRLPLPKSTSQRLTRLWRPISTSRTTTNTNTTRSPCLRKTTAMINSPTNLDRISPNPIFHLIIPFTREVLFTYRTWLICQNSRGGLNRRTRLRCQLFRLGLRAGDGGGIFFSEFYPFLKSVSSWDVRDGVLLLLIDTMNESVRVQSCRGVFC
jgi:hypothetical protein